MDAVAMLQKVIDETTRLVNNTTDEQLDAPTPCTEWKVRDLINHLTGGATMFALSADQGEVPQDVMGQLMGGDNLGADFKGAWAEAAKKALAAFGQPGVMDKIVTMPFGTMPAGVALNVALVDVTTHACDLARATGQKVEDQEILANGLELGKQIISDEFRQPGVFGPEVEAGADAPLEDRLLAFAGRRI